MAKVSSGAGYKQLQRIGNYVSPQINAGADRLAANARQQKQLNAAEKARADKRLDDAMSGIVVDTEALQAKATGFETRDDLARDFAMSATRRSEEYAEKAREAAVKQDWKSMNDWKGKINRIKGDFKNTVNDEAILKETFDKYKGDWQNGDIDDDEWLDFAESMEKFNYEITLDENDNKVIRAIVLDDKGQVELDEEGNPKVIEKQWSDVVNQRDRPYEVVRLEDKEGKKGLIGDLLSTMGKRKYDENTGQYITTTQTWDEQAENQFMAKVKALKADDRSMYSILKQASGGSISKKEDFTEEDEKLVEDFLRYQVKGGYDTVESKKVRTRTPEEMEREAARNRALTKRGQDQTQERAKDRLALDWYKALNPSKGGKQTEETMTMSRLHQDAVDFTENSKPQVINGTNVTVDKKDYTVYDVLEPKGENYITAYMKDSRGNIKKQNIPKTKRGYLDFKLQSPEYKKYTADKVLSQEPLEYQELNEQTASEVQALFDSKYKDSDGGFNGDDADFVDDIQKTYNLTDEDIDDIEWFGVNIVQVGGTRIDLDDSDSMLQVDKAIRKLKGIEPKSSKENKPTAADLISKYSNK